MSTGYPTAPVQASTVNIALLAIATASSEKAISPASGVIDGQIGGVTDFGTGTASQEWVTRTEGAGAWIQLNFTSTYLMKEVILFDRVSTLNQVTSGTLRFSDGTSINVGALSASGSTVSLGSAGIYASSVRFTVKSVSFTTKSAGLSEIQIFNAV